MNLAPRSPWNRSLSYLARTPSLVRVSRGDGVSPPSPSAAAPNPELRSALLATPSAPAGSASEEMPAPIPPLPAPAAAHDGRAAIQASGPDRDEGYVIPRNPEEAVTHNHWSGV